MAGEHLQDALLLEELTALLGSGRFKTLLKHLRTSLRAHHHHHQLSPTDESHRLCCVVDGEETLQCDQLVAEIEQRVTRLESVLSRYNHRFHPALMQPRLPKQVSSIFYASLKPNLLEPPENLHHPHSSTLTENLTPKYFRKSLERTLSVQRISRSDLLADGSVGVRGCHMVALCSSSLGSRGSELHTGAHSNTSPSREPASAFIVRTEPSFDEQLTDERRVCRKVSASHFLSTRSEGEQHQAIDSEHIKWASLPHHALWEILKQLQWKRKSSGAFRSVCKGWQQAHDSMVSSLRLVSPPPPYRLKTKTGFTGVNELDLSSFQGEKNAGLNQWLNSVLDNFSGLRSLNLDGRDMKGLNWTVLPPSLTGLTYLSMAYTNVRGELAILTPFLSSLTDLNLSGCVELTLEPYELASLTALTRLDLNETHVGDEGMDALTPLTALTHLDLINAAVSDIGLDMLAPLAACLTRLTLGGDESGCGDPEMIAVSSLTALTHLEMIRYEVDGAGASEEGLRALSSLTGLVHLELDLFAFDNSDESWRALSSLTAVSHLKLILSSFSDVGANALACLTALTHLDLGDEIGDDDFAVNPLEFRVSDEGARALASLVRLTYLDLSGSDLSEKGVRALCSLTALTHLNLSRVRPLSDEVVGTLCSLPSLRRLVLCQTNLSDEAWNVVRSVSK